MTNAEIIFQNRVFLMEQGEIQGIPGTSITVKDDDGERTVMIPEEIRSYNDWRKAGRQVKKGEHAVAKFQIWMPKKGKAKAEDDEEGKAEADAPKGFYKKMTFFFTEGQTELRKEGN